jgi:hypothetical protein
MKKGSICLCFLLLVTLACAFAENIFTPQAQKLSTSTPVSHAPTTETVTIQSPTLSPTVIDGSFLDFQVFVVEINRAIQNKNALFFAEHASLSEWNCLGDETQGICQGQPADQRLEGIPVTQDWKKYDVYNQADYQNYWKSAFAQSGEFRLAAMANRFGDNPFMPMATQSFQAILTTDDSNLVHVLFFEYINNTWWLRGELATSENTKGWLDGSCASCYDAWVAWQK